jgi:hypothetical protein
MDRPAGGCRLWGTKWQMAIAGLKGRPAPAQAGGLGLGLVFDMPKPQRGAMVWHPVEAWIFAVAPIIDAGDRELRIQLSGPACG